MSTLAVRRAGVRAWLLLATLLFALPYLVIVITSMRPSVAVISEPLNPFGGGWSFDNYRAVLKSDDVLLFYANTIGVTAGIVALQILTGVPAALALGHLRPPGSRLLKGIVIATLSIPIQAIAIKNYLNIADWGLANTRLGLVVPFAASAFGVYLMTEYAASVPRGQLDAAALFDLSIWKRCRYVVLPHMRPGIMAFAAFSFVGYWNEFFWPFIVLQDDHAATLPFWVQTYVVSPGGIPDWGPMMAAGAIALLPLVLLIVMLRRSFGRTMLVAQ